MNPVAAVDESLIPLPTDLLCDDGEPLETIWHRVQMNLLIEQIDYHGRDRTDFFVGGNMFIYFSKERVFHKDFRGPDVFVVLDVPKHKDRRSWISWDEGGRLPDVIIELSSPSTIHIDRVLKKTLYEQTFRTANYFCYDPDTQTLLGWHLVGRRYEELALDSNGRLWCETLNLFLGPWEGRRLGHALSGIRFFDPAGQVVPTFEEAAEAHARDAEAKAREAEAHARDAEAKAREAEAHARDAEAKAREAEVYARDAEAKAQDAEARARDAEAKVQEAEAQARAAAEQAEREAAQRQALEAELARLRAEVRASRPPSESP